ncbi:histone H3-like isoform X2 [Prorops nasuta]|uniref:histone H3-like isoform X2 n=1 Tax=Prorops nasuta TaxID=863751 RepID=UPI0034CE64FC
MVRRKAKSSRSNSASTSSKSTVSNQTNKHKSHVLRSKPMLRGARALQEIQYFRSVTKLLIPKTSFALLIRNIMIEVFPRQNIVRIQASALEAIQEAAEMYVAQFFEDAFLLSLHAKRVTLMKQDMILMRRLRGRNDVINH